MRRWGVSSGCGKVGVVGCLGWDSNGEVHGEGFCKQRWKWITEGSGGSVRWRGYSGRVMKKGRRKRYEGRRNGGHKWDVAAVDGCIWWLKKPQK